MFLANGGHYMFQLWINKKKKLFPEFGRYTFKEHLLNITSAMNSLPLPQKKKRWDGKIKLEYPECYGAPLSFLIASRSLEILEFTNELTSS